MRPITYSEYRRRVFNEALLESMCKIHARALNGSCDDSCDDTQMSEMASRICKEFYRSELGLTNQTITQTKAKLSEAVQFIQDVIETCEDIAESKADEAKEDEVEVTDDQDVELSDEDEEVIEQLFDNKEPTTQIDAIRDATVKALLAEDKKAAEIKQSIDIAQSKVAAGADPATLEETVRRLNLRGPSSLMNAIMNNVTSMAIKDVNSTGNFTSVGKVMTENADQIKTRAVMIYSLYEMASVFGIKKYTANDVRNLAYSIYHEK